MKKIIAWWSEILTVAVEGGSPVRVLGSKKAFGGFFREGMGVFARPIK